MRVAIVHEWLVDYSGSERVVEQLIQLYPDADLFALVNYLPKELRGFIQYKEVKTSFIQHLPFAKKKYRNYLLFMPLAIEQLDVSAYDLVISSNHAVSKGILCHANQLHICYCHSPIRYAWDLYHQYLRESNLTKGVKGWLAKLILHYIRLWDSTTANRVDYFVANSHYIAKRIKRIYNREATIIYPPVEIDAYPLWLHKQDFYLTTSRMVPYKKIDIIVEAFSEMPNRKLIVIGDGPDMKRIKSKAKGNINFLGYQPAEVLKKHMQTAKAFVFAAEEDFGITVVEAQACGTPVIAFGRGGALETVIDGRTGLFFEEQTVKSIINATIKFEILEKSFDPYVIRKNAERFSKSVFLEEMARFVKEKCTTYNEASSR